MIVNSKVIPYRIRTGNGNGKYVWTKLFHVTPGFHSNIFHMRTFLISTLCFENTRLTNACFQKGAHLEIFSRRHARSFGDFTTGLETCVRNYWFLKFSSLPKAIMRKVCAVVILLLCSITCLGKCNFPIQLRKAEKYLFILFIVLIR